MDPLAALLVPNPPNRLPPEGAAGAELFAGVVVELLLLLLAPAVALFPNKPPGVCVPPPNKPPPEGAGVAVELFVVDDEPNRPPPEAG